MVATGMEWEWQEALTIMNELTLRKQRNEFLLLFKPVFEEGCVSLSADTNQPSLIQNRIIEYQSGLCWKGP